MSEGEEGETERDEAEDRAMFAEMSYGLLARAYRRLAVALETGRPGALHAANLDVMRAVAADLDAILGRDPEWAAGRPHPAAYRVVAARLRETLLDAEAEAIGRRH